MQSILKKVIWACLLIVPFIGIYVASGCGDAGQPFTGACSNIFDFVNWDTAGFYFPFISGKNLLFRFLVEVAFFSWVVLALKDPAYRLNLKKSPLLIAYGIFMIVLLLADSFGIDSWKSFWSNFERMEGFFGHIHLFAYFVVLSAMLRTEKDYWKMLWTFVIGNIFIVLYAFGQFLGAKGYFFAKFFPTVSAKFSSMLPIHQSENRLDATLGNSAYFAIYCLIFIFILALMWGKRNYNRRDWWYPVLIVLNLAALFYSGTRGTQIGLLAGGFLAVALIGWFEKGKVRKYAVAGIVVALLLVGSVFAFKESSFIKNSPTLSRFASISPQDLTGMSRLSIWKISYEAWKERPILGYGQENFSYIFATRFEPVKMSQLEPWYDRSHNVFFDWLIAGGILGLLSYLSLYVVALWLIWKRKGNLNLREQALLTGLLAGYFVHNIFVFDNLVSYILFFFILAYIAWATGTRGDVAHGKAVDESTVNSLWAPLSGIAFVGVMYYMVWLPVSVNHDLVRGLDVQRLLQNRSPSQAIALQQKSFEDAISHRVVGSEEAREQFYQTTFKMAQTELPSEWPVEERQATTQAINNLIASARQDITNSYDAHKNDIRMLSIYGMFYNGINDGVAAEQVLAHAHELAPNKQLISFDLVRAYLLQGKTKEAYDLAKETYDLAPNYQLAAKMYLIAATYEKKWNEAQGYIASKGVTLAFDPDLLNALVSTNQISLAIQYLQALKEASPEYGSQVDAYIAQLLAGQVK